MKRINGLYLILTFTVFLSLSALAQSHALAQTDVDTDSDLMPDQWEISNGLNPNEPSDAEFDPDGDRLTNRDEFFAGTNPNAYTAANNMTENQILDLFAGKAFFYFWEQSRPYYYFTPDNANYNNPSSYSNNFNSITTTGFGIMAYVVADDHGWVNHAAAYERIRALLSRAVTLQQPIYDKVGVPTNQQGNRHGYLYHFVDNYGLRCPGSEISTIDHALFVAGALAAAEYYKGTDVEELARELYLNTDWNWLYNGTFLYQGWIEDSAGTFEGGRTLDLWNRYSELMILMFLAMGNSDVSMSIPPSAWDNLTYGTGRMFPFEYAHLFPGDMPQNFAFVPNMPGTIQENGYNNSATEFHYIHAGSLHNHQYSHLFADFRARRDRYQTDFFSNSISATMANRQYCINLNSHAFGGDPLSPDPYLRQPYETYGPDSWGIMAGIPSYTGYAVMQPLVMSYDNFSPDNIAINNDSGTVLLSAPLGSTPFTPRQTIDFTRNMLTRFQANQTGYDALVGRYGFMNSFNLGRPWNSSQIGHFAVNIIGLDMGPVIGSAENYKSGLVWKMTMRNQFIQTGMQNAGFNTGIVEPFILNFDDNPPAPHEDPNGGGADPNSFGGSSYQFGTGAIGYVWIDDPFPSLPYGPQQWAQQISASDNIDSGGFISLKNHDVSRWDRLSFWIKGDTGAEEYSVGLKGSVTDMLGNPIQAIEAKLPVANYHPDGAISSQWREVRIPLRDFADNRGVRLTALDNISFTNTKPDGGTIYIDDIAFLGDEFKPSAPEGLLETISDNSITLSWDANPEPDVVGYRVYRSDDGGATFNPLNTRLTVPTTYTDVNPPGRRHLYRITAVDNAQPPNESDPSDTILINVIVFGTIYKEESGVKIGLEGAMVSVLKIDRTPAPINSALTDAGGKFSIVGSVTDGNYFIKTEKQGYVTYSGMTLLRNTQALPFTVTLYAPVMGALSDASLQVNQPFSLTITATDRNNDKLSFAAIGLPEGATLQDNANNTATFSWNPANNQSGNHTVQFTVTDGLLSDAKPVVFNVKKPNKSPKAIINAIPHSGRSPLKVRFTAGRSFDPDGKIASYMWDFGDGATSTAMNATHMYYNPSRVSPKIYTVTLTVTDNEKAKSETKARIVVLPQKFM